MANNGDETIVTGLKYDAPDSADVIAIGNFHKTLPHNKFGEVDPAAYLQFKTVATTGGDYETVPRGYEGGIIPPHQAGFVIPNPPQHSDNFNDPQAARSQDKLSGDAPDYTMPPAPKVRSKSTAAEMTELQWMALLRDVPFADFETDPDVAEAIADIGTQFAAALAANEPGGVQLGRDLPASPMNMLDIRQKTLFRCGLLGEDKGPAVSQFFLHDIAYGAQFIVQKVRP